LLPSENGAGAATAKEVAVTGMEAGIKDAVFAGGPDGQHAAARLTEGEHRGIGILPPPGAAIEELSSLRIDAQQHRGGALAFNYNRRETGALQGEGEGAPFVDGEDRSGQGGGEDDGTAIRRRRTAAAEGAGGNDQGIVRSGEGAEELDSEGPPANSSFQNL
jgi:hypothetical protein